MLWTLNGYSMTLTTNIDYGTRDRSCIASLNMSMSARLLHLKTATTQSTRPPGRSRTMKLQKLVTEDSNHRRTIPTARMAYLPYSSPATLPPVVVKSYVIVCFVPDDWNRYCKKGERCWQLTFSVTTYSKNGAPLRNPCDDPPANHPSLKR